MGEIALCRVITLLQQHRGCVCEPEAVPSSQSSELPLARTLSAPCPWGHPWQHRDRTAAVSGWCWWGAGTQSLLRRAVTASPGVDGAPQAALVRS